MKGVRMTFQFSCFFFCAPQRAREPYHKTASHIKGTSMWSYSVKNSVNWIQLFTQGTSMWSYSVKNSVNWIQLSTEFDSVNSWIQFSEYHTRIIITRGFYYFYIL